MFEFVLVFAFCVCLLVFVVVLVFVRCQRMFFIGSAIVCSLWVR